MSAVQAVMHEIMAYEKRLGKKPALLILCETEFREKFFSEIYEFTIKTENLDFKTPGEFYGVPFMWKEIWCYGGLPKWMLVGSHEK
jgi:hypothetical protein